MSYLPLTSFTRWSPTTPCPPPPRLQLQDLVSASSTAVPTGWAAGCAEPVFNTEALSCCSSTSRSSDGASSSAVALASSTAKPSCALCPTRSAKFNDWDLRRKQFWQVQLCYGHWAARRGQVTNTCLQPGYLLESQLHKLNNLVKSEKPHTNKIWLWQFKRASVTAIIFPGMVISGLLLTGNS